MRTRPVTALVTTTASAALTPAAQQAFDVLAGYLKGREVKNTQRAYAGAWRRFVEWCDGIQQPSLPAAPTAVASYLAARAAAGRRPSVIAADLAAIRYAHRLKGCTHLTDDPVIITAMQSIKKAHWTPPRQMDALTLDEWERILNVYGGPSLLYCRNRAILTLGLWGAMRRSELGEIDIKNIAYVSQGVVITLTHSKTNQGGRAEEIVFPRLGVRRALDPIAALDDWLKRSHLTEGPLFRTFTRYGKMKQRSITGHEVYRIAKAAAKEAGVQKQLFGAHSMRVSYITLSSEAGVPHKAIQRQTRHRNAAMIDHYTRLGDQFDSNPMHRIVQADGDDK